MDQIACQLRALPFMAFRQTCRRLYHHLDVRLWTAQDAFARFESEHVPLRHLFRQVSAEKFAGLLKGCSACQTRHPMIWFSPFELLKISLVRRCRAVYLSPNGSMTETECRNALDAVSPDLKPWQRSHRVETFAAVPRPVSLGMPSDHLAVADIADTAIVALYLWNGKRRVSIGMHIMIPVVIGTDDRSAPLTESRLRIKSTADAAIRICSHMTVGRYLALAGDFGLFEQVRTETIWCLCQRNQPMYMHGRLLPDHQALLLTIETAYFEGGQDSVATPHAKIIKKDPGIWSPTTTTDEFKLITKHSAGSTDVTG
ncbi:MAG: hypothetical protein M1817_002260 [Caeruleum heppii]|nr:MAG: hypothetical protein M1817_002260 [Caeruleum heppii]